MAVRERAGDGRERERDAAERVPDEQWRDRERLPETLRRRRDGERYRRGFTTERSRETQRGREKEREIDYYSSTQKCA
jgi:hypothetical protein